MRPAILKFMTDENISPRLVAFLRGRGPDVKDVKEEGWQGLDDAELLRFVAPTPDQYSYDPTPGAVDTMKEGSFGLTVGQLDGETN